jgi:hypothetical protein
MMKGLLLRELLLVLFVCLFSSFSTGQNTLTGSSMNGRGWKALGQCKVVFLMGFEDGLFGGLILGVPETTGYPEVEKIYNENISKKLTRAEVISEIDKFYEEGSNSPIPVNQAVRWVTLKARGASVTELENRLVKLRQKYNK